MATEPFPVAFPLQTTLMPCSSCQAMTLIRVWHHGSKGEPPCWEELVTPVSPVTGEGHQCGMELYES